MVLSFHPLDRQCSLFTIGTPWRWGHSFSLSSGSKTTKWALHGALLVYLGVLGGELLPVAPHQPCAEAPLGIGHIEHYFAGLG